MKLAKALAIHVPAGQLVRGDSHLLWEQEHVDWHADGGV
jgi:hypothetical protein